LTEFEINKVSSAARGAMARYGRLLTDAQWEKIRPLLPRPRSRRCGGRPRVSDRKVLEGILRILRSGARWQDLPEEFISSLLRKSHLSALSRFEKNAFSPIIPGLQSALRIWLQFIARRANSKKPPCFSRVPGPYVQRPARTDRVAAIQMDNPRLTDYVRRLGRNLNPPAVLMKVANPPSAWDQLRDH